MKAFDAWLIRATEAVLDWLEEWLSVSQKSIEKVLILSAMCAYLRSIIDDLFAVRAMPPFWLEVLFGVMMAIVLLVCHQASQSDRRLRVKRDLWARMLWLWGSACFGAPACYLAPSPETIANLLYSSSVCAFFYVIVANVEGERGYRRRAALRRLREMFGPLWTPQPQGAQA